MDAGSQPTPWNEQVIGLTGSPDVVRELSRFNVEFNFARCLAGRGLSTLAGDLHQIWRQTDRAAQELGTSVIAIGILPPITESLLSLANMSKLHWYQALNEQVLRLRHGRPICLEVSFHETLLSKRVGSDSIVRAGHLFGTTRMCQSLREPPGGRSA